VIDVRADGPDWAALARLQAEWRPVGLVVGDPLTLDGGDQPNRKRAHLRPPVARTLALPVVMVDERSSSVEAAQRFARARRRPQAPSRCRSAGRRRGRRDRRALDDDAGRRRAGALTCRAHISPPT
jgi:putative Holliday junction resolvase